MSTKETESHPLEGFYLLDGMKVITVTGEETQVARTPETESVIYGEIFSQFNELERILEVSAV